jgi:putative toxin-antitoxin system antitoxin component (TIGR02293 family)
MPQTSLGLAAGTLRDLINQIRAGLGFGALEALAAGIGVPLSELAPLVGIPARTLARRRIAGRLSAGESERVVRLANLFEKTLRLFEGNVAEAQQWLRLPKKALGGESPLDFSTTELGAREVENLVGRIEHGVFS